MRYDWDKDEYVLSTGKTFRANGGVLGLGPEPEPALFEGFDGGESGGWAPGADGDYEPFTAAERAEIAGEMVRRWTEWRDLEPGPGPEREED